MSILITGLKGFTGQHFAAALQHEGHAVFGLDANLCDADAVAENIKRVNPQYVIHLAGISFVQHGDAREIYNVNVLGTYNLLAALEKHAPHIKGVLLVSSAHVYGNQFLEGLITEKTPLAPVSDYAVSKLSMEYMSQLWKDRLPLFIVRPFNYTGVGQDKKFIIPKIVSHFIDRKPVIELGNVHVFREFNDVRFVVDVYCKLLKEKAAGDIFNICSGHGYSLMDVIQCCEKITGHHLEIEVNPAFVRQNEVASLIGDPTALKKFLGSYKEYTLEETLKWMLG